ncbi:pentatricopeptide repeat-containing protein At3g29230-like [Silene latifolia]|uniref:pentatricopeptide repeat-containing protein At3g29230-like n=1 Tax=Silene latifolia TaxID=37657 RepID=UPI003D788504
MNTAFRTPAFISRRRNLEQKLSDLHKCTNLSQIKQIYAQIYKYNLQEDPFIAPKLISAFSNCNQIRLATHVFNQIEYPNVHLYNTLIRAQTHNFQYSNAVITYVNLLKDGNFPDNFTYPFVLRACSGLFSVKMVEMVHTHVEKLGFWGDIFVPNALIDSYCKCGVGVGVGGVGNGRKVFMFMKCRDVVSWNSIIGGLVRVRLVNDARQLFDEMPKRDAVSWNCLLDGYVKEGNMGGASELFERMPERNVVSWSTMVSGYAKIGDMGMARMLFDKMPVKNLVSWTIIISGYAEKGLTKEAIFLYEEMERAGLKLDDGTVISILSACAESGLLGLGKRVHSSMEATRFRCSVAVTNSLVDMYAKCGNVEQALTIFERMTKRDLVSWNVIMRGLAMHGHGETALKLFCRMEREGFHPDRVTFIAVLCACTHMGLVDKGVDYFYAMERDYGLVPQIEHYGCLIDLLGRGGRLEEALKVVRNMAMEPNAIIWGTLLGACRVHNAVELGGEVLQHLIKLNLDDTGNLSTLSNIYAAAGDWDNVANVRRAMKSIGVQKPSGASSIELNGVVHEFTVFDKSHPNSKSIYKMINLLRPQLKRAAYSSKSVYG